MKLVAIKDRLIIKQDELEEKTASGLFLVHDTNKEIREQGVVVSRGDSEEIPANIKVGTKVVIEKGLSQKYEFEGDTYLMCSVFDILAVIEE